MKILHTSDWHLGISLHNYSLIDEQKYFCKTLYDICIKKDIEVLIIAGDVFDTSVSNLDAIKLYNEVITKFIRANIKVIIIAGNHDGATRLSIFNEILEDRGLYITGSILKGIKKVNINECDFYLLPYFNIEEVRYMFKETTINTYEDAMKILVDSININVENKNILVSHSYVGGSQIVDSDKTIMIGGANKVGVSVFEKFDYIALGHLHKSQNPNLKTRYSGSPLKFSFSEANTQKSITMLDSETMNFEEIFITPLCDMRVINKEYNEVIEYAKTDMKKEDFIKVELTDKYAHAEILNTLKNIYPKLLMLEGKAYKGEGGLSTLSMEKMANFGITDIMSQFYEENTGEKPNENQLMWFEKAVDSTKEV